MAVSCLERFCERGAVRLTKPEYHTGRVSETERESERARDSESENVIVSMSKSISDRVSRERSKVTYI